MVFCSTWPFPNIFPKKGVNLNSLLVSLDPNLDTLENVHIYGPYQVRNRSLNYTISNNGTYLWPRYLFMAFLLPSVFAQFITG